VGITAELDWMLLRAFGPIDAPLRAPANAPLSVEHARRFALGPRIATRIPAARPANASLSVEHARRFALGPRIATRILAARLSSELGDELHRQLVFDRLAAMAEERRVLETARRIAEVAGERSLPLVFTKYSALRLSGMVAEGSRGASDVDVLAPEARARELHRVLGEAGFRGTDLPDASHHLAPLVADGRASVEIHTCLPGLRLAPRRRFVNADALLGTDALVRIHDLPGSVWVPVRELLLAHAIAHGFAQHGFAPGSYPLLRALADVVDLAAGKEPDATALGSHRWLADGMTFDEVLAICRLARSLELGLEPRALGASESLILRHVLAGTLDPDYERALKLAYLGPGLTDRSAAAALLQNAWRSLSLTQGQLEIIYPGPHTALGWFGLRLYRPVDLAVRTVRAAAGHLRVARERRRGR
jgi:hypothetical protein